MEILEAFQLENGPNLFQLTLSENIDTTFMSSRAQIAHSMIVLYKSWVKDVGKNVLIETLILQGNFSKAIAGKGLNIPTTS